MKRAPLYSRSSQRTMRLPTPADDAELEPEDPPGPLRRGAGRVRGWLSTYERAAWAIGAVALALLAGWPAWTRHDARVPTFEQIDTAMRESIAKEPLQSAAANAYEAVIGSVVRVVGEHALDKPDPKEGQDRRSVGSGVVIVDKGLILTNLHVVQGATRIKVTYSTGLESEATLVNVQPENDLAVLQAADRPDELEAATMRSTNRDSRICARIVLRLVRGNVASTPCTSLRNRPDKACGVTAERT